MLKTFIVLISFFFAFNLAKATDSELILNNQFYAIYNSDGDLIQITPINKNKFYL